MNTDELDQRNNLQQQLTQAQQELAAERDKSADLQNRLAAIKKSNLCGYLANATKEGKVNANINKVLQDLSSLSYSHRHFTALASDAIEVITSLERKNAELRKVREELVKALRKVHSSLLVAGSFTSYDSEDQDNYYFSQSFAYQTGIEAFQKAEQYARETKANTTKEEK